MASLPLPALLMSNISCFIGFLTTFVSEKHTAFKTHLVFGAFEWEGKAGLQVGGRWNPEDCGFARRTEGANAFEFEIRVLISAIRAFVRCTVPLVSCQHYGGEPQSHPLPAHRGCFGPCVCVQNEPEPAVRKSYQAVERDGEIIRVRDTVLLKSGPRKKSMPYVAKISALWEDPKTGTVPSECGGVCVLQRSRGGMDVGRAAGCSGCQGDGEEISAVLSIWIVPGTEMLLNRSSGVDNGNLAGCESV